MSAPNTSAKPIRIVYHERRIIYICPKCGKPIKFKRGIGNSLCIRCGQRLDWEPLKAIQTDILQVENGIEAAEIAEKYYEANEMQEKDWINLDEIRRSLRNQSCELYLLFKGPKEYGRFKRISGGKK